MGVFITFAAMNRIDRVTAMLIQLQSRRVVKAQDFAERFGISLRTVYRDIRTLEEAGVPVSGEAGIGYSLMEGYRLPPVMFTPEEATAFLTAEKLIETMTDTALAEHYKSAMFKVKAVLRTSEKDQLETLDEHIRVLDNPYLPAKDRKEGHIPAILKSITEKTVLSLLYFASHSQSETERYVEPIGIFHRFNQWHLIGYCHLRKDYRDFRLDRIRKIFRTSQAHSLVHPPLENFIKTISEEKEMVEIIVNVSKEIIAHFGEQKYYHGFIKEKTLNHEVEMTFLSSSLNGFARWYMMYGDYAEIVKPEALKQEVALLCQKITGRI